MFKITKYLLCILWVFCTLPAYAQLSGGSLTQRQGILISDEGVSQGRSRNINFTGSGVTASVTNGVATINITGGGGGGSAAGSAGAVQLSDGAGNFIDDGALTYDTGTQTLSLKNLESASLITAQDITATGNTQSSTIEATTLIVTPQINASTSAGLSIYASNGTTLIGDLGAANTANVTWYGSHNFDAATADRIAGFVGAGKTLTALSTTTYPSLTELSYVKGVTSAIQTQLNGKLSTSLTSANVFVGNGSNVATGVALTGDVSITNAGVTTVVSASDTASGKVELATIAETNTGTDATRAVTPDALAGSYAGTKPLGLLLFANGVAVTTGDKRACIRIPASYNGMNMVTVGAAVNTTSSSGTPTVQLSRGRQANATTAHAYVDMLSTRITIDASEYDSKDATTAAVIDTANDDVATGDLVCADVDVAGTGTQGLIVNMEFRLP